MCLVNERKGIFAAEYLMIFWGFLVIEQVKILI